MRVWADEGGESHFDDREVVLTDSGPNGRRSVFILLEPDGG